MEQFEPQIASVALVVSIAEASLGGLRGRAGLLIGPEKRRRPYREQLQRDGILRVFEEENARNLAALLPRVQLLMYLPDPDQHNASYLTAAAIARGCAGRRAPLVILDLAESTSIEELAGLLPAVCLYTPDDLRAMLARDARQVQFV
jgi:hypothetical protein